MNLAQTFMDGLTVLGELWTVVAVTSILVFAGCGVPFLLNRKTSSRSGLLIPVAFFIMALTLRLAFLKDLFVPPYFDSVEHYRIIMNLVTTLETDRSLEKLRTLTPAYYHLGFHILASLLVLGLRAAPLDVILVLGQVILAAIPLPVYFLVWRETANEGAAFFAMLLAGFGWYMPGFAVNWGKYPALAGLLALEIVLGIAYGIAREKQHGPPTLLVAFLLIGAILAALFHTRVLIIIGLSIVSWQVAGKIEPISGKLRRILLGLLLTAILGWALLIQSETQLKLALDPYISDGSWVTLTVIALSPFALFHHPRAFYFNILLISGMLVALFVPAGIRSPELENQTLLDRPFVEMALYLPFSLLGGLGLAGLLKFLSTLRYFSKRMLLYSRVLTALLLLGFAGLFLGSYDFHPSDCCNFVRYDDTIALDWLDRNLPADARILVAGTALNVLPTGPSPGLAGTDAGIWIPNLTGRSIALAPFDSDFGSEKTLEALCQMQIEYIYVGGTAQKFSSTQLGENSEWYEKMLLLPNAQLYQMKGCKKQVTLSPDGDRQA